MEFTFAHREEGFDSHIENSIRGYNDLLNDVVNFSRSFVEDETNIVDVGSSTGKTVKRLIEFNNDQAPAAYWNGIELETGFQNEVEKRRREIRKLYPEALVNFELKDIRDYIFTNCSLVTSIFTLQFMSMKDRQDVVNSIYKGLNDGGAFIFAEKINCEDGRLQDMMTFNYYDFKSENFDYQDIMTKEKQLRHMLKPYTYNRLKQMLEDAGFSEVQSFWQNHLFVGIIALK